MKIPSKETFQKYLEFDKQLEIPKLHIPITTTDKKRIILMGGRSGMKSETIARYVARLTATDYNLRIMLARAESTNIKNSILFLIKSTIDLANELLDKELDKYYEIQDTGVKRINLKNCYNTIFTFGFKGSSNNLTAKTKGIEKINYVILEEAEDIRDKTQVKNLEDTVVRNDATFITVTNTPDKFHHLIQTYYDLVDPSKCGHKFIESQVAKFEPIEYENYFYPKLKPNAEKEILNIFTVFNDNPYLDERTRRHYLSYGEKDSPDYDLEHFFTKILGLVASGRSGRVFKDWGWINNEEFNNLEYPEIYGLDFGYSNDPTALVCTKSHNDKVYAKELLYQTGLTTPQLITELKRLNISDTDIIYADSSAPAMIAELRQAGYNIYPAVKGSGSVQIGINYLLARQVFMVEGSSNLNNETQNYIYTKDKDYRLTNTPVDESNHLIDAIRYAMSTKSIIKSGGIKLKTSTGFY